MTALAEKLKARIAASGPISIADYMNACLADPEYGYYRTHEPFGSQGDFVTAPEVSQMFGELIGAVILTAHEAMGRPGKVQLVELGPGQGTLMADLLRMAALRPAFIRSASLSLVEMSTRLRSIQQKTLKNAPLNPTFLEHFRSVPEGPAMVIANEFFDALPIHQFVKTTQGWFERQVGLNDQAELAFGIGPTRLDDTQVPKALQAEPEGAILETQPAANAIAEEIATRLAAHGGFALFLDYGYLNAGPGDTLQALHRHAFDPPLANPGDADLTAHVNFEALARAATNAGATVLPPLEQGEFLLRAGLLERAGQLGNGKSHKEQEALRDAVERLAAPDQMGKLFKVLAITGKPMNVPPFDQIC